MSTTYVSVDTGKRCAVLAATVVVFCAQPISTTAQEATSGQGPIYTARQLRLDPSRLQPHRLLIEPLDEIYDQLFVRGRVQVKISLDRGQFSGPERPEDWLRIRWHANTHPNEDRALLDGRTLGLRRLTSAVAGTTIGERHASFDGRAVAVSEHHSDSVATRRSILSHDNYYHLITIPYVMAASDLEPGSRFRLPQYLVGSDREGTFSVEIVGTVDVVDSRGHNREVWRVDTDHGYARIEWYLDRFRAPHLLGYRWSTMVDEEVTRVSVQWAHRWAPFQFDVWKGVMNRKEGL